MKLTAIQTARIKKSIPILAIIAIVLFLLTRPLHAAWPAVLGVVVVAAAIALVVMLMAATRKPDGANAAG